MALRLETKPFDLDLGHGVTVTVRPMTAAMQAAARADIERAADKDGAEDLVDELGSEFVLALAIRAIKSWDGVLDMDDKPLPCEADSVRALFEMFPGVMTRFTVAYLERWQSYVAEGNVSPPSPTGSSDKARGGNTARGAKSKGSLARKGRKARTASAARTSSTH